MTTFSEKLVIVSELVQGLTPEFLAEWHQTTEEEINKIIANLQLIIEVSHYFNISQRLPLLGGYYPHMEKILFCWLADHGNVTNKALSEKARQIVDIIGERPKFSYVGAFTGTQNWVRSFKARYRNISFDQRLPETDIQPEPVLLSFDQVESESQVESERQEESESQVESESRVESETQVECESHVESESQVEFEPEAETLHSQNFYDETSTIDEQAETVNHWERPATPNEILKSLSEELMESVSPSQQGRQMATSKIDELTESPILVNRKRSVEIDTDEYSPPEDLDDSEPQNKRRRNSENILVPTKTGVKFMNLQDYKENKVIRIFKPLLKFAKDSGWSAEDCDQLNKLYRKCLLSCDGKEAKQTTITNFFRKKK